MMGSPAGRRLLYRAGSLTPGTPIMQDVLNQVEAAARSGRRRRLRNSFPLIDQRFVFEPFGMIWDEFEPDAQAGRDG
jgi:hypothetical protein